MALGRQGAVQEALLIGWQVPTAPGHVFYSRLNGMRDEAGTASRGAVPGALRERGQTAVDPARVLLPDAVRR